MDIIYRCGWCGRPVQEDGEKLQCITDDYDANHYILNNIDAEEIQVNGYCCPNGDGEHR